MFCFLCPFCLPVLSPSFFAFFTFLSLFVYCHFLPFLFPFLHLFPIFLSIFVQVLHSFPTFFFSSRLLFTFSLGFYYLHYSLFFHFLFLFPFLLPNFLITFLFIVDYPFLFRFILFFFHVFLFIFILSNVNVPFFTFLLTCHFSFPFFPLLAFQLRHPRLYLLFLLNFLYL